MPLPSQVVPRSRGDLTQGEADGVVVGRPQPQAPASNTGINNLLLTAVSSRDIFPRAILTLLV